MMVNICGIPYTVREVSHPFVTGETHLGEIDYMSCEILINENLPGDLKREVLCHEIVHGILHHLGYEEENDEKMVQQLGNAINQTFFVKDMGPFEPKGEKDEISRSAHTIREAY